MLIKHIVSPCPVSPSLRGLLSLSLSLSLFLYTIYIYIYLSQVFRLSRVCPPSPHRNLSGNLSDCRGRCSFCALHSLCSTSPEQACITFALTVCAHRSSSPWPFLYLTLSPSSLILGRWLLLTQPTWHLRPASFLSLTCSSKTPSLPGPLSFMPFWICFLVLLHLGHDHPSSAAKEPPTACGCPFEVAPTQIWANCLGSSTAGSDTSTVELPSYKGPEVPCRHSSSYEPVRALEVQVLCPHGERNHSLLWRLPRSLEPVQRCHVQAQAEEIRSAESVQSELCRRLVRRSMGTKLESESHVAIPEAKDEVAAPSELKCQASDKLRCPGGCRQRASGQRGWQGQSQRQRWCSRLWSLAAIHSVAVTPHLHLFQQILLRRRFKALRSSQRPCSLLANPGQSWTRTRSYKPFDSFMLNFEDIPESRPRM